MLLAIVMFIALTYQPVRFSAVYERAASAFGLPFPNQLDCLVSRSGCLAWALGVVSETAGAQNQQCRALASDRLDASVNCRNRGVPFRQSASGVH